MNFEVYEDKINPKYGTKFSIPMTCCSTLMSAACGKSGKEASLDGQIVPATKLKAIAGR